MTQFIDLTLDWNRGAGWMPIERPLPTDFGAEVPCTIDVGPSRIDYEAAVTDLQAAGVRVLASHTVGSGTPEAQATALASRIGDPRTPVLLLPDPAPHATALRDLLDVADAMIAAGLRPRAAYIPEFYWRALGSPDLYGPLAHQGRGLALIAEPDFSAPTYPGNDSPAWCGYGGWRMETLGLLHIRGLSFAAYRGTADDLATLLGITPLAPAAACVAEPPRVVPAAIPADEPEPAAIPV